MNKTSIEWCHYSWNPVSGCLHGCDYCYATRIANRFKGGKAFPNGFTPTYHPSRLSEPGEAKKPSRIFVGSMGDLFGNWNIPEYAEAILRVCEQYPQHRFIFLTKNPARYEHFKFHSNCWIGTSVTGTETQDNYMRCVVMGGLEFENKFISIEPMQQHFNYRHDCCYNWLILGAETGNRKGRIVPEKYWIDYIIAYCKENKVPLFIKDNVGYRTDIKQYPKGLEL